jgi:cytochrome c5
MKLLKFLIPLAMAGAMMFATTHDARAQSIANGQSLYTSNCQGCHGAGATNATDTNYRKVGNAGTANTAGSINTLTNACGNKMPCGTVVTASDISDVVAYIQSKNGNSPPAAAPAISLSSSSIAFGSMQVGMTVAAKTVTLTNSGTAALTISSITLGGTNAGDFMKSGTCVAGSVAAGASCTLGATFTPAAAGTRAASFSIVSNAPNSPHTVNLSGTGTAAPPPATPVASITPPSLSFGSVLVGSSSAAQTVTVANTGTAPLNVGAVAATGAFTATGCANMAVAAGANCKITVTFKPTAAGAATGSLSIAHNATGSPGTVALSGTGTTAPPTGTPAVSFSPMSLNFMTQKVGMTSAAQTVTVNNTGTAALSITSWSVSGSNATDFAMSGGTCTAGSSVAAGASCTAQVTFKPSASGSRMGSLDLQSNAAGAHSVALSGMGTSDTNGLIELSQNGLVIDKIKMEDNGTHAKIKIKNNSNAPIKVAKITFLVGKNYKIEDQCSGKTLYPGKTCEIEMEYKGPKVNDIKPDDDDGKPDALIISTDAGDEAAMPIQLQASEAPVATTPAAPITAVADSASPKTGGCTIGGDDQFDASHLAMLLMAAGALLVRRRQAGKKQAAVKH